MQDENKNNTYNNLNEAQASRYLGLKNKQTLSNWRHLRKGPAYCRVCRRIVYRRVDLDAYLDSHRVAPEESYA